MQNVKKVRGNRVLFLDTFDIYLYVSLSIAEIPIFTFVPLKYIIFDIFFLIYFKFNVHFFTFESIQNYLCFRKDSFRNKQINKRENVHGRKRRDENFTIHRKKRHQNTPETIFKNDRVAKGNFSCLFKRNLLLRCY